MSSLRAVMMAHLCMSTLVHLPVSSPGGREEPRRLQEERIKKAKIKRDRKRAIRSK